MSAGQFWTTDACASRRLEWLTESQWFLRFKSLGPLSRVAVTHRALRPDIGHILLDRLGSPRSTSEERQLAHSGADDEIPHPTFPLKLESGNLNAMYLSHARLGTPTMEEVAKAAAAKAVAAKAVEVMAEAVKAVEKAMAK